MKRYTVHSGDKFDGCEWYQVLKGPGDFEVWLTEPEDRNFYRDLEPILERLEQLEEELATLKGEVAE